MDSPLNLALQKYLAVLEAHGSPVAAVIKPSTTSAHIDALASLDGISLGDELVDYLRSVDGLDPIACHDLGLFEPELAWGMFPLDVARIKETLEENKGLFEDPDYWPDAFVPILWDGSGSYVVVNAMASSPTFGAVYDMSEGVGCNQIAPSISRFLEASGLEITSGLRRFDGRHSVIEGDAADYLRAAGILYGHSAYFSRPGRMGTQIVDWK